MTYVEVVSWVMITSLLGCLNAIWNPSRYAISTSLLIVACSMFAYTSALINWDNPDRWFAVNPPWFVSRITLAAIIFVVMAGLWRVRCFWHFPERRMLALAAITGFIVPVTVLSLAIDLAPTAAVSEHSIVAFSVVLTAMIYLALALSYIEARMPLTACGQTPWAAVAIALCALASTIGFLEIALDIGFIRNMFFVGVIELRATSTFANPNWFALCLAPFVFIAIYLAMEHRVRTAQFLMAFATLGLIVSGSRSTIWVITMSVLLFVVLGRSSGRHISKAVMRSLRALIAGATVGAVAGGIAALAMGPTAIERYYVLLVRIVAWPLQMWTTNATMASIWGRFNLSTLDGDTLRPVGAGIVDNAYFFLYGVNPVALALLLIVLVLVTHVAISRWRLVPSTNACLKLAICGFVLLSGLIGQVYWAFPVWIAIAVLLAWTLVDDERIPRLGDHDGQDLS